MNFIFFCKLKKPQKTWISFFASLKTSKIILYNWWGWRKNNGCRLHMAKAEVPAVGTNVGDVVGTVEKNSTKKNPTTTSPTTPSSHVSNVGSFITKKLWFRNMRSHDFIMTIKYPLNVEENMKYDKVFSTYYLISHLQMMPFVVSLK